MKKRVSAFLVSLFATIGVISFGVASQSKERVQEAEAAIDITDYSSCNTYHNAGNASSLLTALRTITSPGSAGSYAQLWSTYNTCYVKSNGKMFDYYSSASSFTPGTDQAGSYKDEGDVYNREHSIPKSWWGGAETNQGADPYIVVPTDGYVNNKRSNYPMGVVKTASYTSSGGFSKLGTSASTYGYSGTVFEPDDSVKGDFARIVFYAIAKYSASYGWTSGDGSSTFSGSSSTNFGLTNYAVKLYSAWSQLDPVSDWEMSVNDKVSAIQKNRNPFVDHPEYANTLWGNVSGYTQYTHADTGVSISQSSASVARTGSIQINATSSNSSTISWSSSNTSIATVSDASSVSGANITITGVAAGSATITASATINQTVYSATCTVTVTNGTPTKLSTPQPSYDSSTKRVSWDPISNASSYQVKVDNGSYAAATSPYSVSGLTPEVEHTVYVKAIGDGSSYSDSDAGQVQFTPTSGGGGQTGEEITLEVDFTGSKSSDTDSEGNVWTTTGSYTTGASYLRLNSSDTYFSNDPALMVDTGETMSVTASLRTYGGVNSQSLRVTAYNDSDTAISNTLVLSPTDSTLRTYSGTLTFTNSTDYEVTIKAYSGNNNSLGISGISFTYTSWAESSKTLTGINVQTSPETSYESGETFDPTGLVITRTYSDDSSDTYAYAGHTSEFTFDPSLLTPLTVDDDVVEITYGGQSCFLPIDVIVPKVLSSISLSGYTTAFVEGGTFSYGGMVTAHYADTSIEDVTSSATFSGYNMITTGNQTVTVSYGGKSQTYQITVSQGTLSSIAVTGQTTEYVKNASFSFDGTCTATFANEYQKVVTPTSVTSPDMSTTGNKTITVSYTYNGNTRTTTYQITVSSYRTVMEETYSTIGTIVYTTGTEVISVNTLSTGSTSGYSQVDKTNNAYRLGSGNNPGSVSVISTTANIYKITVNAKSYGSDSGVSLSIAGTANTLTSTYTDYTKEFATPVSSVAFATAVKNKRALIASFTVYTKTNQDIGQSEDCIGLETFINTYMHMDYTENLGYCSDSTHHYYSTAKTAFNALNTHQRSLFTGNSAYSAEWARLSTWASKNGDSLNSSYILALGVKSPLLTNISSNSGTLIIVIAVLSLNGLAIGGYFLLRKRKED